MIKRISSNHDLGAGTDLRNAQHEPNDHPYERGKCNWTICKLSGSETPTIGCNLVSFFLVVGQLRYVFRMMLTLSIQKIGFGQPLKTRESTGQVSL